MSRDVKEDLVQLLEFVSSYSIGGAVQDPEFRRLLSRQHKPYHAALTALSEIQHQGWYPLHSSHARASHVNAVFDERLLEFASDIGSAFFAWLHGAYKNARLSLRSGIENFIKAIGVTEHDDIVRLRNTYEVFDLAESLPFFSSPLNSQRFTALRNDYAALSLDVHTATRAQMEHVGALSFFPRFSAAEAGAFARLFDDTTTTALEILCLMYPDVYRAMHHRNRDIVNVVLGGEVRAQLNREDRT